MDIYACMHTKLLSQCWDIRPVMCEVLLKNLEGAAGGRRHAIKDCGGWGVSVDASCANLNAMHSMLFNQFSRGLWQTSVLRLAQACSIATCLLYALRTLGEPHCVCVAAARNQQPGKSRLTAAMDRRLKGGCLLCMRRWKRCLPASCLHC